VYGLKAVPFRKMSFPQPLKPIVLASFMYGLNRLRKNSGPRKDVPQGLKPGVFSIIYGTTKVVP
jgi:hypothetical protein